MKKSLLIVYVLALIVSLTACGKTSAFNGSRTGNDKEFIMEYSVLNTTDRQELSAEAGDTIHTKIVVESGNLSIKIQKNDEKPIYENNGIEISNEFGVAIDESGIYSVTVTGEKTKGSVSFVVESN